MKAFRSHSEFITLPILKSDCNNSYHVAFASASDFSPDSISHRSISCKKYDMYSNVSNDWAVKLHRKGNVLIFWKV